MFSTIMWPKPLFYTPSISKDSGLDQAMTQTEALMSNTSDKHSANESSERMHPSQVCEAKKQERLNLFSL